MGHISADIVVVGGGSSGCVVAGRLAERGRDVLLIEAGGEDNSILTKIPRTFIQALGNAAHLEVIGVSDDGVIEAIRDPSMPFYVGVQWHPERTDDTTMGLGVIRRLVDAARRE